MYYRKDAVIYTPGMMYKHVLQEGCIDMYCNTATQTVVHDLVPVASDWLPAKE